jgi:ABC-type sugar transport system substrate-binding protein
MMKTGAKLLAATALLFCLTMGVFAEGQQEAEEGPAGKDTFLIGVSQPNDTHPLRRAQYDAIRDYEATHPGVKFIVTSARLSANKQAADIEDLITMGCDLILVCPHQSKALTPSIRRIDEAGIPIMSFDRRVAPVVEDLIISHIGPDFTAQGRMAGEAVVDILDGEGNILVIEGVPGSDSTIRRMEGFLSALEGTNINILDRQVGNYQREEAIRVAENMLQAHTDVDLIYAENDEMGLGVMGVVQRSDRDILIGSTDGQKQAIKAIIDTDMYAFTVTLPLMFPETADVAYDYLQGNEVPEEVPLPSKTITDANAEENYDPNSLF